MKIKGKCNLYCLQLIYLYFHSAHIRKKNNIEAECISPAAATFHAIFLAEGQTGRQNTFSGIEKETKNGLYGQYSFKVSFKGLVHQLQYNLVFKKRAACVSSCNSFYST
jgi:hypothetical protein